MCDWVSKVDKYGNIAVTITRDCKSPKCRMSDHFDQKKYGYPGQPLRASRSTSSSSTSNKKNGSSSKK